MIHKIALVVILSVMGINAWAWQSGTAPAPLLPDSVIQALDRIYPENKRMDYLFGLVRQYQYEAPSSSMKLANEALIRAIVDGDKKREAIANYWLGWLEFQNTPGPYDEAMAKTSRSIQELSKHNECYWLARAYGLRAALAFDMSRDSTHARADLASGFDLIPRIKKHSADSLWALAYLNSVKGNVNGNDLASQMTSLQLFELSGDQVRIGRTCVKLSNYFMKRGDYTQAEGYIQRAVTAYATTPYAAGQKEAFQTSLDFFLRCYALTGNEDYFNKIAQEEQKHAAEINNDAALLSKLGVAYAQKAYFYGNDPVVSEKYMMTAKRCFEKALPLAVASHELPIINLVTNNLLRYCEKFQNCDSIRLKVATIYTNELAYKNSVSATTQTNLEKYYNAERQATLNSERQRQSMIVFGFLGAILFLMTVFIIYNQRHKNRILHKELRNRMEALRAQMNPHFISNALNAIDSLVNHNRNKEASYYIIQFSRLCRIILNNSRSETITLGEELEMLRYFLNLEKLRLGEKLSFDIDLDTSLNKDNITLPPMILQPFVENAIWHGIQPNNVPGLVTIKVLRANDLTYQCIIEDNGVGRERSKVLKEQMVIKQPSHGLAITEERLETIKKIKGSDIFTEDLLDSDDAAAGTRVTITLPF